MGWWALVGTGGPPYLQSVRSWQPHLSRGGAPRPGTQLAVKYQQLLLNEHLQLIWQLYFNFLPLFKSPKLNHMKGTISLFSTSNSPMTQPILKSSTLPEFWTKSNWQESTIQGVLWVPAMTNHDSWAGELFWIKARKQGLVLSTAGYRKPHPITLVSFFWKIKFRAPKDDFESESFVSI